jgi:hypothetical protein
MMQPNSVTNFTEACPTQLKHAHRVWVRVTGMSKGLKTVQQWPFKLPRLRHTSYEDSDMCPPAVPTGPTLLRLRASASGLFGIMIIQVRAWRRAGTTAPGLPASRSGRPSLSHRDCDSKYNVST